MIGTPEQDAFIDRNKWAVATTLRRDGSPTSSVVFFARDGEDLVFSTTRSRLKARTVARDSRIALCVLDEGAPFGFLTVEGTATIQEDGIVPPHVAINRAMRGQPDWNPPEGYVERLAAEGRVIVRVRPRRVSGMVNRQ
ncbi:MAG: TIGR03618 family F420-dependent PPOX class oxidoreductase [Dehalococcoidia bacterium]|nr:TIGR03618 family F420-dependent PPOX class oxidoreductase [Chloroflexi bacterium CFX7]MCK6566031.1 TIGR03618 family F420-dependent PPOX class oxidoreductase [Dehalococcoidia bacterium]NUQ55940.1 TIGR03618 family F420-dependent PPOX class oxidoreductase [Dehalococcoidia bacterium]